MKILSLPIKIQIRGRFAQDVLKLSFGTFAGRAIALAAMPFVTRLYGAQDFALLAAYLSIVTIVGSIACLRLEIAIPIADSDEDAADLSILALGALSVVVIVFAILVAAIPGPIANWLHQPTLEDHLWMVPIGIALVGIYSTAQFLATRARRFGDIARARLRQAAGGAITMLALGWAGITPTGLLLGNMFNIGGGGLSLALAGWRRDNFRICKISIGRLSDVLLRYRRYPLLSTPESLLNVGGTHLPLLLIASFANNEAGYLLLAIQVMATPMALLGNSIAQVYISRAPEEYRRGTLPEYTSTIMRRLIVIGVGPLVFAAALAPPIFPIIFGADWAPSGVIAAWMSPWIILQFIASPVSMVMFVVGRQMAMLLLTVIGIALRVGLLLLAIQYPIVSPALGFVIGSICYYATVFLFVIFAAGMNHKHMRSILMAIFDWRVLIPSILAGVLFLET